MIDALEYQDTAFKSVSLEVPDDPGDSIWLHLEGVDEEDTLTVYDETEEVGASALAFLGTMNLPDYGSEFITTLAEPLTRDNKWDVASTLFGAQARAKMEQAYLSKQTPKTTGANPKRRM
jgi:hypothetical protein